MLIKVQKYNVCFRPVYFLSTYAKPEQQMIKYIGYNFGFTSTNA